MQGIGQGSEGTHAVQVSGVPPQVGHGHYSDATPESAPRIGVRQEYAETGWLVLRTRLRGHRAYGRLALAVDS